MSTVTESQSEERDEESGRAVIRDGAIVIRIPLSYLPQIVEGAWGTGNLHPRMKIMNVDEFAADLVSELDREEEDGSTRIHRMFDAAINEAINQGAFGIEEHEDQQA